MVEARLEGHLAMVGAKVEARGEDRVKGRGARPSTPPTEQGSHRGVTRHALAVDLHLDQRPLLAPEQVYGYSDCTHVDIVRACACACACIESQGHTLRVELRLKWPSLGPAR